MCEIGDCDGIVVCSEAVEVVAAIAEHRCDCCRGKIKKGDGYFETYMEYDGVYGVPKERKERSCLPCWKDNVRFAKKHRFGWMEPSGLCDWLDSCIDGADFIEVAEWYRMRKRIYERAREARHA